MRIKFFLLILFTCLPFLNIYCQNKNDIQAGIDKKLKFISLSSQLDSIKRNAELNGDDNTVAKCFYQQLQIADLKTEDSLYFKNSLFIDSILAHNKKPLMQSIMLVLKAKRIGGFRQKFFFKNNKNLIWLPEGATDYRKLNLAELDSLVQLNLEQAKNLSLTLKTPDIHELLWLSTDPLLFLFKPVYTDLIIAEQLHYMSASYNYFSNSGSKWLELSPDIFINSEELPAGLNKISLPIYRLYRQWAQYHQQDSAAFYFIESIARKYFYSHQEEKDSTDKIYESYLQQLTLSSYAPVKANGVYQLFLLWNKFASAYENPKMFYDPNTGKYKTPGLDSGYRYHYVKALDFTEKYSTLLDSFTYLKENIEYTKQTILAKKVTLQNRAYFMPGETVSCRLSFKNTPMLHLKVAKLYDPTDRMYWRKMNADSLAALVSFKDTLIQLPETNDHQTHSAIIDAGTLPLGYYAILYSDSAISKKNSSLKFFTVSITGIAAINNDNRVFILNRKTGMPLTGAKVTTGIKKLKTRIVNNDGYITIGDESMQHSVAIYGQDTTIVEINEANNYNKPEDIFDKEEDELVDYYEDNMVMHVFTDRAIYRPGQTVYFKGILLTRDPVSGERIVASKQNLGFPLFKKMFDEDVKEFRKEFIKSKLNILVNDAFGKTVDTIKVFVNKYGSVTGSYKISEQAATGEWEFETDLADNDDKNDGRFKVEEYKRPTFELNLKKPENYLQLGDSFFVKAQLTSFAGSQLTNVAVDYTIDASFYHTIKDSTGKENEIWEKKELSDTTGYTNDNGELLIKIPAGFLKAYNFNTEKTREIRYQLEAQAYDATGESHEAKMELSLSNRPVKIDFSTRVIYEKNELDSIPVIAKNQFAGTVTRKLEAKIYKIAKPAREKSNDRDASGYDAVDYEIVNDKWIYFSNEKDKTTTTKDITELIYQTSFTSGIEKLKLPKDLLITGEYKLEIVCTENGNITGERTRNFSVFEKEKNSYPDTAKDFHYLPFNSAERGGKLKWIFGTTNKNVFSIYHTQYFAKKGKRATVKYIYEIRKNQNGISQWDLIMPLDAINDVYLTHIYILNNKLYKETATIYAPQTIRDEPEIIIEQYRKKLTPGSKETFAVTIKTKNEHTAAELMTTMYDASLDKIEKHKWEKPFEKSDYRINTQWQDDINKKSYSQAYTDMNYAHSYNFNFSTKRNQPLWWLNPLDYSYQGFSNSDVYINSVAEALQGRAAGVSIVSGSLDEVVTIGYGTMKKDLTGSVSSIRIRGVSSLSQYNIPLVIIDGVIYEGDISKIDPSTITDGLILKGADASAIYGARALNGVIVISTKGPLQLLKLEEPAPTVRKNFSETAFFFPQVYADAKGYYNISFEIPESVTEWNWKMLAHTKKALFAYAERKIITQLPLMVQPNMPRYLYQGDSINLQTRISNLDTNDLSGISNCIIEDAETGENITAIITSLSEQNFSVNKRSNNSVAYSLKVPENYLHPLKIRIIGRAGNFSDGEEYIIPVLNKKILATLTVPFVFSNTKDSSVYTPWFPKDVAAYGIGIYITPKKQAALINALPYLAFYPYNCAEQTFNKMLAHATAIKLYRKDKLIQQESEELKKEIENINTKALPGELNEQIMPWLQLDHQTKIQQQQLAKVFDTLLGRRQIEKYMSDLFALQKSDGGISWFGGGQSNRYISYYLLEGFGRLKKNAMPFIFDFDDYKKFTKMIASLISYCDKEFMKTDGYNEIQYLSARSYWLEEFLMPENCIQRTDAILSVRWSDIYKYDLEEQAKLALVCLRYKGKGNVFFEKAKAQLESIRQLAITDDINGTRWKNISDKDDISSSDEETISLLAEAYDETGYSKQVVEGIIRWLLANKEQHNWRTTKATASVINILNNNENSVTGTPSIINAVIEDSIVSATDNLFKGNLHTFKKTNNFPEKIILKKGNNVPTKGGVTYYYFTANPVNNAAGAKVLKQIFRKREDNNWETVSDTTVLKIAEKVKIIITIETMRQLKYVLIDDKRAAALDPVDATSGYEYGKNFSYYKSVRDAGFQFFAEQVPSGISTIEYETVVAKEGKFSTGITSLQCMYNPEIRTYSGGININSVKK